MKRIASAVQANENRTNETRTQLEHAPNSVKTQSEELTEVNFSDGAATQSLPRSTLTHSLGTDIRPKDAVVHTAEAMGCSEGGGNGAE